MLETLGNMTLGQLFGGGAAVLVALSFVVELVPVKICPVSIALNWIGKRMNKEVMAQVKQQGAELDEFKGKMEKAMAENTRRFTEHEKNNDTHEINRMRQEIMDFSNACQNHKKHTARQFAHIIALEPEYNALIDKWGIKNGEIDQEFEYIKQLDLLCKREGKYLPEVATEKKGA